VSRKSPLPVPLRSTLSGIAALCALASAFALLPADPAGAEPAKPAREEDGKYFDKDDTPTYNVKADGGVDWYSYSGYRRYHAECHVCHGPDGMGSSYAPALIDSLKRMSYQQFTEVVVQGRQNVNSGQQSVMPSFGTNNNVMCYLDDIYVYLRARSEGAMDRTRPSKREDKPQAAIAAEKSCLGG
jgi:methanol metabolism-related c-type cytochrome